MALTVLGLSGAVSHDPSAALYIDGKLVAAVEEERFVRDKHAKNRMPYESAKFCLEQAGIEPADVDVVAIPFAPISIMEKARWHYAKRYAYAPDRALDAILLGNRRYKRYYKRIEWCLQQLGFDLKKIKIQPVEHHLAHASSAYHCSGFKEKTAILGIDGKGEYATTFFGWGENGRIHKIKEFYDPDSLGGLYGAITEYLGFDMLDGEFKVMGMAPYGDASKYDFSRLAKFENGELVINTDYANVIGFRRYKEKGKGYYFSPKLIEWLGPKREGDIADDPYIHYAASIQALFEKLALEMMDYYLGDIIRETGKVAFAGGCALNVKLNQKIISRPEVKELFVHANAQVSAAQREQAGQLLSAVGIALWLDDEAQIDAVTAVSGSGPAYFFLLMQAMTDAGEKLGLSRETASRLTLQTALGAAQMALSSEVEPAELRRRVTSPNGTTEAAIKSFQANGFEALVEQALNAASQRSAELAEQLGQ